MKAEIIEKECESKSAYPCLMQSDSKLVVLFVEKGRGTVVVTNGEWKVGDFSGNWIMNSFHKFEGRLILEND